MYRKPNTYTDLNGNDTLDPYAQIAHCLIYHQDGFYGFAEPYFIHHTLKDLVLHYRETSLFEHNDELDTTLRIPIGMVDLRASCTGPQFSMAQVFDLLMIAHLFLSGFRKKPNPVLFCAAYTVHSDLHNTGDQKGRLLLIGLGRYFWPPSRQTAVVWQLLRWLCRVK